MQKYFKTENTTRTIEIQSEERGKHAYKNHFLNFWQSEKVEGKGKDRNGFCFDNSPRDQVEVELSELELESE